ncbi:MAG: hypothetical protein JRE23_18610 [Deltaproteobacteria bacterium]|nr:hypothetical protein [Deltaproteobacteria bacterium]
MYVTGQPAPITVYMYDLSTAWDVKTAIYTALDLKDVSAEMANVGSLRFSSDGETMYLLNPSTNDVFMYALSTAWDVKTAGYTSLDFYDIGAQENGGQGLAFVHTNLKVESTLLKLTHPDTQSEGEYQFENSIDLGGKYTSRVTPDMHISGENLSNFILGWATLAAQANLGGTDVGLYDAHMELRITDDDPTSTPTWSEWLPFIVGDYSARAFEFKAHLISLDPNVTPVIDSLAITVDMPDRTYGEKDLTSNSGSVYSVTYSPAFKVAPAVAVSAQGMATGDYYVLTNKTASGFDIRFYNSTPTGVARDFDYVAKGYGYVV